MLPPPSLNETPVTHIPCGWAIMYMFMCIFAFVCLSCRCMIDLAITVNDLYDIQIVYSYVHVPHIHCICGTCICGTCTCIHDCI